MTSVRDLYRQTVISALPRLLHLLDRNPTSPTYGCFDRSYWLHRKTDFASSTAQLSMHTLALLYTTPFPQNSLYQSETARQWAEAAVRFALRLQHRDGSFDEWYPNERGWAGPTGYVAHALFETLRILEKTFPPPLVAQVDRALERAARHLALRDEGEILTNHHAISLLPLTEIAQRLKSPGLQKSAQEWLEKFKALANPEGWSLEYDGCDIAYNLGTLDFLTGLHHHSKDPFFEKYAEKALTFLSHFAYPDGSWAGALSSRHTVHSYPFALEYWAGVTPAAHALLKHQREALQKRTALTPGEQEDHYIHYRLADYVKASEKVFAGDLASARLPYEAESFSMARFPAAGFHVEKRNSLVLWVALKRGGVFRLYDLNDGKLRAANNGCQILRTDGANLVSLWQAESAIPLEGLAAQARFQVLFHQRFSPFTFLLFRLTCFVMIFSQPAHWLKLWIRKKMITHRRLSPSEWTREIDWTEEHLKVRDRVRWHEKNSWEKIFWGGDFHSRYVPQAQYFTPSELCFPPVMFEPKSFSDPTMLSFEWTHHLSSGESRLCVQ